MTGPYNSIIGMKVEVALARFLRRGRPEREVAEGDVRLCGAIVETDDATGRAISIVRVQEPWPMVPASVSAAPAAT